jgi:PPOX class probable F420-dependent enzyme
MTALPEEARALIESDALAHLVTLNADGTPQVTCIWVGLDGDEIVSGHLRTDQQKLRNVRRDPRVSLSLEGTVVNEWGLKEYLVVHGLARLTDGAQPSCSRGSPTRTSARTWSSRAWRTHRRAS